MTVDFTQPVQSMPNGSYIVTLSNGWPYNVVQGDSSPVVDVAALWQSIQDWLAAGNTAEDYAPPAAVATLQSPAQLAAAQQAQLASDQWEAIQQGLLALANGTGTDALSVALQGMIKGVT
jgi:hypothetical protein